MSKITTIDLLRHGEPLGGRRYRGQIDDPLSEKGWTEMWNAIPEKSPWELIISSPLRRCSDFAQKLSKKTAIPLVHDKRLMEVGFGTWEGKTSSQLRLLDPDLLTRFYEDPINNRPPGAEPLDQFSERVNRTLDGCIATYAGKHLLIIAHAGVIRAVLTRVVGAPLSSMYRLSIGTATLSRIQKDEERPLSIMFQGRHDLP